MNRNLGFQLCMPGVALASLVAASGSAIAMDACSGPNATCWGCFQESITDCESVFPDPGDLPLRDACIQGAGDAMIACATGSNDAAVHAAWSELLIDLQQCEQQFSDPIALQDCIDLVYERFRDALDVALGNGYVDPVIVNALTGMPVNTLEDIRLSTETNRSATNYVTVEVGQTLTLPNAGVGQGYTAFQVTDADSVVLMATYRTKLGTVTRIVDQDMDLSDDSPLSMYLDPNELVHADQIILSAMFVNAQGLPLFFETGVVLIPDSVISGDYNRDSATNGMDLIEYVDGFGNDVRRADVNENGDVEPNDLGEFVDDYNAGS